MDAKTAWPDRVTIDGTVHKARVEASDGMISLPYTTEPQVSEGDVITQTVGRREVAFEVLEANFQPNGSLGIGTIHRHLLVLSVEPTTSQAHTQPAAPAGRIAPPPPRPAAAPVSKAAPPSPLKLAELVDRVARGSDTEAKTLLLGLLGTASVSAIVGPVEALGMRASLQSKLP